MSFFNFLSADEVDELPHEDGERAFVMFASIAAAALNRRTENLNSDDETQWLILNDMRHSYVNVIVAAAKTYNIEPFATVSVPRLADFGERDFRQFSADLDHYVTQLMLGNSIRKRRDSVDLPQPSKDKIRTYLHALRECVEKADLSDAKREQLLVKIEEFEAELEKRRLTLLALTKLIVAVAVVPGGLWASGQVAIHLVTNVAQVIGEAKVAEDEARQLPASEPQRKLSPPRPTESNRSGGFEGPRVPAFDSSGLDDDIPF